MDSAFDQIKKFEERIDLPNGFYLSLLKESDWSFVIKLHSLFEGASTHILNLRLGEGRIESALAHLEFSHPKYGKSRLLKDLGVINSNQTKFLQFLSERRNDLAHKIGNVSFSFGEYIQGFDSNQRRAFCNKVGYNTNDPITIKQRSVPRDQFICENPKLAIWLTASDILACICVEEDMVDLDREKREFEKHQLEFAQSIADMNMLIMKTMKLDK